MAKRTLKDALIESFTGTSDVAAKEKAEAEKVSENLKGLAAREIGVTSETLKAKKVPAAKPAGRDDGMVIVNLAQNVRINGTLYPAGERVLVPGDAAAVWAKALAK